MEDKQIRKETLRKLLTVNEEYCKKQNQKIDSLEGQLELMIKERNMYKDKYDDSVSLKKKLKRLEEAHTKLIKAYAKKIGVWKEKKSGLTKNNSPELSYNCSFKTELLSMTKG